MANTDYVWLFLTAGFSPVTYDSHVNMYFIMNCNIKYLKISETELWIIFLWICHMCIGKKDSIT